MTVTIYELAEAAEEAVVSALEERGFVAQELQQPATTLWDTFDWRIHGDGGRLVSNPDGGAAHWVWSDLDGTPRRSLRREGDLAFSWDLPPGPFRTTLAKVLSMRRLLPLAELHLTGTAYRALDDEGKAVSTVEVLRGEVRRPGPAASRKPVALSPVLRVSTSKGYRGAARETEELLKDLGLEPRQEDLGRIAFSALGLGPGGYSSKMRLELDSASTAAEAMIYICRELLEVMRANEDGLRRDLDSEFLHDFRVAVRRTRSALSQIRGVLPQPVVDHFKQEFKWLGSITGPTRDLDVYLLKMPQYGKLVPEEVASSLGPLEKFLVEQQKIEHRRLVEGLDSDRYQELLRDWQRFLATPTASWADDETAPNAGRPVGEVASARIWKAWRRVWKKGSAITPETPADPVHDLRIDAKKLRYLLEFFKSLYPKREVEGLIKALKGLQDNLGDFNDYEVQQAAMDGFAHRMHEAGKAPVDTMLAMGRLLDLLARGQARERDEFEERFTAFTVEKNRAMFRKLFSR